MKITKVEYVEVAVGKINRFLKSTEREIYFSFLDGASLHLKKHTKKGEYFLEIHTGGYDDTMPIKEAVNWIEWELIDRTANGFLQQKA